MRAILPSLGYRNSLLVYAGISAVIYLVAFFLLETRKPPAQSIPQTFDTKTGLPPGIWKDPAFWSLMIGISVGVWGFLSPSYFLTSATIHLNPSLDPNSLLVALPLILLNVAIGVGRIGAGFIADVIGPTNGMFASFFAGGVLCLAFWSQIGENQFGLMNAFAVLYGLLGSWFFLLMAPASAQVRCSLSLRNGSVSKRTSRADNLVSGHSSSDCEALQRLSATSSRRKVRDSSPVQLWRASSTMRLASTRPSPFTPVPSWSSALCASSQVRGSLVPVCTFRTGVRLISLDSHSSFQSRQEGLGAMLRMSSVEKRLYKY